MVKRFFVSALIKENININNMMISLVEKFKKFINSYILNILVYIIYLWQEMS
jgi:hypothetical protein